MKASDMWELRLLIMCILVNVTGDEIARAIWFAVGCVSFVMMFAAMYREWLADNTKS